MLFNTLVNYFPYPRFENISSFGKIRCTASQTVEKNGFIVKSDEDKLESEVGYIYTTKPIDVPANTKLNFNISVEMLNGATPDTSWGYLYILKDATKPDNDYKSFVVQNNTPGIKKSIAFTSPLSGKLKFQLISPRNAGGEIKISDVSITSPEYVTWMKNNDKWFIADDEMPITIN